MVKKAVDRSSNTSYERSQQQLPQEQQLEVQEQQTQEKQQQPEQPSADLERSSPSSTTSIDDNQTDSYSLYWRNLTAPTTAKQRTFAQHAAQTDAYNLSSSVTPSSSSSFTSSPSTDSSTLFTTTPTSYLHTAGHNVAAAAVATYSTPQFHHHQQQLNGNVAFAAAAAAEELQLQNAHIATMHYNLSTMPPTQTGANLAEIMPTEIPREDEERLERIFKQLDRNEDGKIDIHDLSAAMHEFGMSSVYAEKFLQQSDRDQSGNVGFAEFLQYVREHEKNLVLQFSHLDKNRDGKVDLEELISAFNDLGLDIDVDEATKLLSRMDKDGSLNISFNEWRDYMLLAGSTDIHDLIKFWRHSTYLDIGEDLNVPDDFTQKELQTGLWWRHLMAGGIAGAVSRTCTAPLDRMKVFLQVQTQRIRISECLRLLINEGGILSMWRGNGVNILKIAPETALKFTAYEQLKNLIRGGDTKRQMTIGERFCAGAAAGGIAQTIIYPMEVLKTRLALRRTGQYTGIVDAAKKICHREGVRAFYRGYVPNMLGIVPYAGIDLAVYETLKRRYIKSHDEDAQPSFLVLLACGSTSSALGQLCSYPLALVRTRLQAEAEPLVERRTKIPLAYDDKRTMVSMVRDIVRTEGLSGLYRGITPNFVKVLPAVSISYVVYEYTSRMLGIKMS